MSTVTLRVDRSEQNDLARRVRNFLDKQTNPELRSIKVEVSADVVHLRGNVGSQYAHDLAARCCERVAGVRRVVNETVVGGAFAKA